MADTVGTYIINVTCNVLATFYRYESDNSYTWSPNSCHMSVDAMPSYQEKLNNETSQFYQENQEYIQKFQQYAQQFQQYSQEASVETSKAQHLSELTIIISTIALITSYFAIPRNERKNKKSIMILIAYSVTFTVLLIILLT
jgi:hypothetical protein